MGQPFDPCWRQACDSFDGIDRDALAAHVEVLAFVLGSYSFSTEDINGVPPPP